MRRRAFQRPEPKQYVGEANVPMQMHEVAAGERWREGLNDEMEMEAENRRQEATLWFDDGERGELSENITIVGTSCEK